MTQPKPTPATRVVSLGNREVRLLQTLMLEVEPEGGQRRRVRMDRPLYSIGSHPSNELELDDPTISKHHLEIEATPEGYRISDLASSNGTWLEGARLGTVIVNDPITLRVGHTTLRVIPGGTEVEVPAAEDERFGSLVGRSAVMRELFEQLARVAQSDCSVVFEGETGTGKDGLARALHDQSSRAGAPFVVLECAGLNAELIEDSLFGHIRGAFTGAEEDRVGLIESASGGTLYLDEVADLPLQLQSKLLGVLDRKKVQRIGSRAARAVDVRLIAGSQRNLAREVNLGRLRADLFYRISVVRLRVPPLRERLEDLPLLVGRFLDEARARGLPDVPGALSSVALARLRAQVWPGNVRELKNAIDRMLLHLPDAGGAPGPGGEPEPGLFFGDRERALAAFERDYFKQQLAAHNGNLSAVSRATRVDRRYLQRILKRLKLIAADTP